MVDSGVRVTEMGCDVPSNIVAQPVKKNMLIKEIHRYLNLNADRFFIKIAFRKLSLYQVICHYKIVGRKIKYFTNFNSFHRYFLNFDGFRLTKLQSTKYPNFLN